MEIDIKIYIQNLKKFFTSNEGGADLLKKTGIEIDEFLEEIVDSQFVDVTSLKIKKELRKRNSLHKTLLHKSTL